MVSMTGRRRGLLREAWHQQYPVIGTNAAQPGITCRILCLRSESVCAVTYTVTLLIQYLVARTRSKVVSVEIHRAIVSGNRRSNSVFTTW
jgi:hypothetical protein